MNLLNDQNYVIEAEKAKVPTTTWAYTNPWPSRFVAGKNLVQRHIATFNFLGQKEYIKIKLPNQIGKQVIVLENI